MSFSKPTCSTLARREQQPSPIFKLHRDVLWHIFSLNTHTDQSTYIVPREENSLITIRHTSQVCNCWRTLILGSSSLWANMISLCFLEQKKDDWRNEVMRRTGNSPLNVNGFLISRRQPSAEFFLSLLAHHWSRIRILNIGIDDDDLIRDNRWLVLQSPAPYLEVFNLEFFTDHPQEPPTFSSNSILFSDHAPRLWDLQVSSLNFNLSRPWALHIRTLRLGRLFTAEQLFDALQNMPALERLSVDTLEESDSRMSNMNSPIITLPKLKFCQIQDTFEVVAALLTRTVPATGCTLLIVCSTLNPPILTPEDTSHFLRSFLTWFRGDSIFSRIKTLSWMWRDDLLGFQDTLYTDDSEELIEDKGPELFSIQIEQESATYNDSGIAYVILRAISSCDLSTIETLELGLDLPRLDLSNPVVFDFFFKVLTNVRTLYANSDMIQVLVDVQKLSTTSIVLPRLQTIVFNTDDNLKGDVILYFLVQRRGAGVPIKVFDLGDCSSLHQDQLIFLKDIDGLKVVWNYEFGQFDEGDMSTVDSESE